MIKKLPLPLILGFLGLFLVSTGVSLAGFTFLVKNTSPEVVNNSLDGKVSRVDLSKPKTESCPINGEMYTKAQKDLWMTKRPIVAVIENHLESRPQSSLSKADVVYEAIAEGGVTRFMAMFYCGIAAYDIGLAPVRSARTYFVDWVSEYDALYNHVGGAGRCSDDTVDERAKALCQIGKYGINGNAVVSGVRNTYTGRRIGIEREVKISGDSTGNIKIDFKFFIVDDCSC